MCAFVHVYVNVNMIIFKCECRECQTQSPFLTHVATLPCNNINHHGTLCPVADVVAHSPPMSVAKLYSACPNSDNEKKIIEASIKWT